MFETVSCKVAWDDYKNGKWYENKEKWWCNDWVITVSSVEYIQNRYYLIPCRCPTTRQRKRAMIDCLMSKEAVFSFLCYANFAVLRELSFCFHKQIRRRYRHTFCFVVWCSRAEAVHKKIKLKTPIAFGSVLQLHFRKMICNVWNLSIYLQLLLYAQTCHVFIPTFWFLHDIVGLIVQR